MIMSERINAVSPRIGPVVTSKAFFHDRSTISVFRCECLPIHEQRQQAVWKNAVVCKSELLWLNDFSRNHRGGRFHLAHYRASRERRLYFVKYSHQINRVLPYQTSRVLQTRSGVRMQQATRNYPLDQQLSSHHRGTLDGK